METSSRIEGDKDDKNSPLIEDQDQLDEMENGTDTYSAQGQIMYNDFKLLK